MPIVLLSILNACGPQAPGLTAGGAVPGGVALVPEHTLSAGDVFVIRFPFAPDYNDQVTVGMDGTVSPKQIGSVLVGGLTVPEATGRLRERYAKLLKAPELSITVRRFAPEVIYVDGWVSRPGLIRSDIPLTLMRALAQAGGVKTGAKTGDILIMRREADGTLRTYEGDAGLGGGPTKDDPLLKSFDVVYVPQSPIAAVADFARQYYGNVPFTTSFRVTPTAVPSVIAPQVRAPATPAPATLP